MIINYSASWGGGNPAAAEKIKEAGNHGVLIVAISGNNDDHLVYCPAGYAWHPDYQNVIAVGATDPWDQRASYSNYGDALTVVAPGGYGNPLDADDIRTTTPNYSFVLEVTDGYTRNYSYCHGTSFAAPHVAGLAALIWSYKPDLPYATVREIIEKTADDRGNPGRDDYYGHGRINAFRALQYLGGTIPVGEVREWKKERKDPQQFDILLAGDVVIPAGATLRIEAGTVIRFAPKDYAYQEDGYDSLPEIIVKGNLEILGTEDNPVIFERHADTEPSQPAWYGIRFIDPAVPKTIPNCEFRDAIRALSFSGVGSYYYPFTVDDCIVENCSSDGIFIEQSVVTIRNNSSIRNNAGDGIHVENCLGVVDYVNILSCSIWENGENGITFINVYEGNPADTIFAGNVSGCDIRDNNIGINLQSGEVKIRGCDIHDNSFYGVYSSQTAEFPDIWPNLGGFEVGDQAESNWGKNNIYGNGSFALVNDSWAHPIFAIGNYWGTNNPDNVISDHDPGGVVHFQPFRELADGPYEHPDVPVDIIDNTTWSEDRTIAADVTVMPEATLTINPGVTIRFLANSGAKLIVEGTLIANGTTSDKITFKSDASSPTGKDWGGIVLKGTGSHLNNCVIEDADFEEID